VTRRKHPPPKVARAPTVEDIKAALDQLEAAGLIERDRDAEARDGQLHIRLKHFKPPRK